jgi:hypothetical protein
MERVFVVRGPYSGAVMNDPGHLSVRFVIRAGPEED